MYIFTIDIKKVEEAHLHNVMYFMKLCDIPDRDTTYEIIYRDTTITF